MEAPVERRPDGGAQQPEAAEATGQGRWERRRGGGTLGRGHWTSGDRGGGTNFFHRKAVNLALAKGNIPRLAGAQSEIK
jgi:hypothetical protein